MECAIFRGFISIESVVLRYDKNELQVLVDERAVTQNRGNSERENNAFIAAQITEQEKSLHEMVSENLKELISFEKIYVEQVQTRIQSQYPKHIEIMYDNHSENASKHPVVIIGCCVLVASSENKADHEKAKWVPVSDSNEFDTVLHPLLQEALTFLNRKIEQDPIAFYLLPEKFSLNELQQVYETVTCRRLDKRNFRKKIAQLQYLTPLNEKQKNVRHKPASLYCFNGSAFERN
ncbi:NUDIX hydrolase [Marinifilum sp. D737]|uniref:NUDIX hydrolase n=1 Tax=Marinifilum sp. D737 TaxID=2969628 RepID=UPI00227592E4|nr:hypothetical protein [Marinifilum sp. D737]MCY1633475.1 hypothetical protein [Marinifilum sp. D737]